MPVRLPFKDMPDFMYQCATTNDPGIGQMSISHTGLLWLCHFGLIDSGVGIKFIRFVRKHKFIRSDYKSKLWTVENTQNRIQHPFNCSWSSGCIKKRWCENKGPYIYMYKLFLKSGSDTSELELCKDVAGLSGLQLKLVIEPQDVSQAIKDMTKMVKSGLSALSGYPKQQTLPLEPAEVEKKIIPLSEVYELNKKRDTCINCGKATVTKTLLTSSIQYCPCIELITKQSLN